MDKVLWNETVMEFTSFHSGSKKSRNKSDTILFRHNKSFFKYYYSKNDTTPTFSFREISEKEFLKATSYFRNLNKEGEWADTENTYKLTMCDSVKWEKEILSKDCIFLPKTKSSLNEDNKNVYIEKSDMLFSSIDDFSNIMTAFSQLELGTC